MNWPARIPTIVPLAGWPPGPAEVVAEATVLVAALSAVLAVEVDVAAELPELELPPQPARASAASAAVIRTAAGVGIAEVWDARPARL
jgi:hypothetical protein